MQDAVIFVDAGQRVIHWNSGAERMTGIAGASVYQHTFSPRLMDLRDDDGGRLAEADCPVTRAIHTGEQRILRLIVRGRNRQDVNVEAHVVPVVGAHGAIHGAALLMRDVSPQLSLEARCHSLHQLATKDPLTQVANRAEFNRVHEMFVAAHLERRLPCSLIICDLDRFKSVNDTYGHPAGDEVLQSFAKLLKTSCRPGDLVARYGGEEFAMLCADCGNATAVRRAEEIRRNWSQIPHACCSSKCLTASFGVTEVQLGDTTATMLARADRALYDAKEGGRNKVVQLGTGIGGVEEDAAAGGKAKSKKAPSQPGFLAEQHLVTLVPMGIAIEKLRGFVADHQAEIVSIEGNDVRLKLGQTGGLFFRRSTDRQVAFVVDLRFEEDKRGDDRKPLANGSQTRIHVTVSPQRNRDRRRADAEERARLLLASFRAYLMATEEHRESEPAAPRRGKTLLLPWLRKKGK
jgi:diguanylate cyclase (GGDEF)-like protein